MKLWMLRRLKYLGAPESNLVSVYTSHIRSVLEMAVPLWHNSITQRECQDLERVQKNAMAIILYSLDYICSQVILDLESLESRRENLCITFAKKASKNEKHSKLFHKVPSDLPNTRGEHNVYFEVKYRTQRYNRSSIPYLTRLLNSNLTLESWPNNLTNGQ